MTRFPLALVPLAALALGVFVIGRASQAQAQPDRYLLVPDQTPCCLAQPIGRHHSVQTVIVRPAAQPAAQPAVHPVVRTRSVVRRRIYVTPPRSIALRPVETESTRVVLSLVGGVRRPVRRTGQGAGVVTGARIAGDFGWSHIGLRFDFTHFAEEDEYRTALEWRFIGRQHEMFRPYASFAPAFSARRGLAGTLFGFGVEAELGLSMHHDTTHGALQVSVGVTGSAAYQPELRRSFVDVGVRAGLGFAFQGAE